MIPKNECPECGSNKVVYRKRSNELVCKSCGSIFSELAPKDEKKFERARSQK